MSDLCGAITDWPRACGIPLPCALHPHVTAARVHPSNAPQSQQSETTFEAIDDALDEWWHEDHFGVNCVESTETDAASFGLHAEDCVDAAFRGGWRAALRSRQVAPGVVERIAKAISDDRMVSTPLSSKEQLVEYLSAVITEAIAQ